MKLELDKIIKTVELNEFVKFSIVSTKIVDGISVPYQPVLDGKLHIMVDVMTKSYYNLPERPEYLLPSSFCIGGYPPNSEASIVIGYRSKAGNRSILIGHNHEILDDEVFVDWSCLRFGDPNEKQKFPSISVGSWLSSQPTKIICIGCNEAGEESNIIKFPDRQSPFYKF